MADTTLNSYLYDLAKEVLDESVEILTAADIDPPSIQAVRLGEIVDDGCDQISVAMERLYNGLPGIEVGTPEQQAGMAWSRTASFVIRIIRCVSMQDDRGRAPTVTDAQADSLQTYSDIWALHQGLIERYHNSTFLETCQSVLIGNALPTGPDGGVGGYTITIDAQVS